MGGRQGLEIGKLLRKLLLAGDSKGLLFIVIKITAVPRPPALGDEGGVHLGEGEGEGEGRERGGRGEGEGEGEGGGRGEGIT